MKKINENIFRELYALGVDTNFLFSHKELTNGDFCADEVCIVDSKGILIRVSKTYEQNFGADGNQLIGRSVFDLEAEGVFSPCLSANVLRQPKTIVMPQVVMGICKVQSVAVPVFDDKGDVQYVVCFKEALPIAQDGAEPEEQYRKALQELYRRLKEIPTLILKSGAMQQIWDTLCYTANTKAHVLITGETGTGKSAVARTIHKVSNRMDQPFVEIDCAAIQANLLEAELFGYEKGAFTGADTKGKIGKIELAEGGTLFLDEVGELPLRLQTKMLQLIQDRTIERLGGTKKITVDFKLICATNKVLHDEVEAGRFRKDLFYRLNVLNITLPPLRERREDIRLMAHQFLSRYNSEYGRGKQISREVLEYFEGYSWPGNIRQLENLIERLVISCISDVIKLDDLPQEFMRNTTEQAPSPGKKSLTGMLEELEKRLVMESYQKYGTTVAVAKDLGISQATAARKIQRYTQKTL